MKGKGKNLWILRYELSTSGLISKRLELRWATEDPPVTHTVLTLLPCCGSLEQGCSPPQLLLRWLGINPSFHEGETEQHHLGFFYFLLLLLSSPPLILCHFSCTFSPPSHFHSLSSPPLAPRRQTEVTSPRRLSGLIKRLLGLMPDAGRMEVTELSLPWVSPTSRGRLLSLSSLHPGPWGHRAQGSPAA